MSTESKSNVISLKGSGKNTMLKLSGKNRLIYDHCLHQTTEFLGVALSSMLDKVDDVMFELANKAEHSQDQNLYFDTMRSVRLHRSKIEQEFLETLKNGFQSPGVEHNIDLGEVAGPSLSLVDQDTLEEDLAITNMVSKLQNTCHAALYELDKRIGFLLEDPDLKRHDSPLRPEALCQSFKQSIGKLESDIRTRLLIYKLFDKHVVNDIGQLYTRINQYLIEKEILPVIRSEVACRPSATNRPQTENSSQQSDNQQPAHAGGNFQGQGHAGFTASGGYQNGMAPEGKAGNFINTGLAGAFQQYLSGSAPAGAMAPQEVLQTPLYTGLSQLQQGHLPGGIDASTLNMNEVSSGSVNVLRALQPIAAAESNNPADEQTIELVALIFDYILDDENVAAKMKAQIGRLQIPILKVALLDKSLFARKTHPARQLLNRLATIALSWNADDPNQDHLYEQVETAVEQVIENFDDSTEIFVKLDRELADYQQSVQKQASVRAERCAKVIEGRERLEAAARSAEACCRRYIDDEYQLPDFIINFVARYWKEVLRMIFVREGEGSEAWHDAEATLQTLCWTFDQRPSPSEAHEFVRRLPQSVKSLRLGLDLVSMPTEERDEFFDKLAGWHSRLVKQAASLKKSASNSAPEVAADEPPQMPAENQSGTSADTDTASPEAVLDITMPEPASVALVAELQDEQAATVDESADALLDATVPEPPATVESELSAEPADGMVGFPEADSDDLLEATQPQPDALLEQLDGSLELPDEGVSTEHVINETEASHSEESESVPIVESGSAVEVSLSDLDDSLPELENAAQQESQADAEEPDELEADFESTVDKETLKSFFGTDDMEIEEVVLEEDDHQETSTEELPRIEIRDEQEQDEYFFMASTLKLGHWVELSREDERPVRARLTWISQSTGTLLFTDRQGRKVAEKTVPGLAAEFKRGAARVLANAPLFDRAISSLVERFQKAEEAVPQH